MARLEVSDNGPGIAKDDQELRRAMDEMRDPATYERLRREVAVLREMAEGKSNSSIAGGLHLSESSVEKYVNSIFSKLGLTEERLLSRRVAAVLTYLRAAT